jgi:hypothetical protein
MLKETRNQKVVFISAIVRQVELIEMDIADAKTQEQAHFLVKVAAMITVLTVASFPGHEGFYLDIAITRKHINEGATGTIPAKALSTKLLTEKEARNLPQLCICLLGKFKGETSERYHSIIVANETSSGLRPRFWLEKLLEVCKDEGRTSGPAFNNPDGSPPSPMEYNAVVRQYFKVIQEEDDNLIDSNVDVI